MSALVTALDYRAALVRGEKGSLEHKSSGADLLDLFAKLTRGMPADALKEGVEKVKASASQADPPRAAEVVAAGITLRTFAEIEKCKLRHAAGGARGAAEVDAWLDGVCAPLAAHAADGCGPVAGAQASSRGSSKPGAATVTVSFCEGCGMSLDMIRREDPALSLLAASKTKPSARPLDAV